MRSIASIVSAMVVGWVVAGCGVAPEDSADPVENAAPVAEISEALTAVTNSCVCIGINEGGGCGNGAIGGNNGQINTGISTATVLASYGPDRTSATRTGWACRTTGTNSCVCIGINEGGGCGNGAVGGNNGQIRTGITTASVLASYGPDRTGATRTGWKCRLSAI